MIAFSDDGDLERLQIAAAARMMMMQASIQLLQLIDNASDVTVLFIDTALSIADECMPIE